MVYLQWTCRSNFSINFMLPVCAYVGKITILINQYARYEDKYIFNEYSSFNLCLSVYRYIRVYVCLSIYLSVSLSLYLSLSPSPIPTLSTGGLLSQIQANGPPVADTDFSGRWKFFAICSRGKYLPDFNTAVLRKRFRPYMDSMCRH